MVRQHDAEGFGGCTNHGECQAACPQEISIKVIGEMNAEYRKLENSTARRAIGVGYASSRSATLCLPDGTRASPGCPPVSWRAGRAFAHLAIAPRAATMTSPSSRTEDRDVRLAARAP